MIHQQVIQCRYCERTDLQKTGKCQNGAQRYFCTSCKTYFHLTYRYNACKEEVKEKIIEMTLNSSGVRDIGRMLKKTSKMNPYFLTQQESETMKELEIEIRFSAELDEFWSFVGNKSNQRWTWYGIERNSGVILAWHNGKRRDKDFLVLWEMLERFPISLYHTDDWGSYSKYIPAHRHRIGKDRTWKIERKNLISEHT